MKKILMAAAAVMLASTPALADTTVGIVNVARIMHDSKAAESVRTQMQAKQKDFQTQLDSKEKELLAEDQSLVKQKDAVDKDAFNKKVADFRQKAAVAQKNVQDKKLQLDKALGDALADIQKATVDVTKEVATEKKMNLVVTSGQVIYGDPALDITDEVLKRLDARLPTVAVKF